MCSLERTGAVFGGENLENSLLNSLLAGNLGREELAPDCLLRHTVWSAEKSAWISLEIAEKWAQFRYSCPETGP
jgi:hypothetical protein